MSTATNADGKQNYQSCLLCDEPRVAFDGEDVGRSVAAFAEACRERMNARAETGWGANLCAQHLVDVSAAMNLGADAMAFGSVFGPPFAETGPDSAA